MIMGFNKWNGSHTLRLIKIPSWISPQRFWSLIADLKSTLFSVILMIVSFLRELLKTQQQVANQTNDIMCFFFPIFFKSMT